MGCASEESLAPSDDLSREFRIESERSPIEVWTREVHLDSRNTAYGNAVGRVGVSVNIVGDDARPDLRRKINEIVLMRGHPRFDAGILDSDPVEHSDLARCNPRSGSPFPRFGRDRFGDTSTVEGEVDDVAKLDD